VVPNSVLALGALGTLAVIGVVSLANIVKLAGGGAKVAQMMGARLVAPNTTDRLERRLVNIVEEMAIASGVRLPQVYIMDNEKGINAFAAGWSVSGSVVAVTRGTLERLTRDELQGVIGHEFSHILNGDMSLNIRMIGVLAGIVFIGSIGAFIMRGAFEADDIRAAIPIFILGLVIFLIGYTGLFFARLIKASVSRQREFLADASSVQFTRNPDGIAGALDQIRASGAGTLIKSRYAEEMSHMFFGQSVKMKIAGLFATHPPLEDRILRVNPRFQPTPYRKGRDSEANAPAAEAPEGAVAFAAAPAGRRSADNGTAWGRSAGESAQLVGSMGAAKLDYAARLLGALPPGLRESLRELEGARAAVIALLLAPKDDVMAEQLKAVEAAGHAEIGKHAARAAALTKGLGPAFHMAVVDLALPALKAASAQAKQDFLAALEAVINADRRVSLHELVVLTLAREQLEPRPRQKTTRKLAELEEHAATLLSLIAHAGTRADASGQRGEMLQVALAAGAAIMSIDAAKAAAAQLSLEHIKAALEALRALAPLQKALLVKGLFAAVTADGTIRVVEAELMRLVGAVLDCPLPPLLDEIDPAALAA
jgi:Zn-dependent protease with chaperone function